MTWRVATLAVWGLLLAILLGCQVAAATSKGRLPGADALFRVLTGGVVVRALVILAWMWLGWHAFAR